MTATALKHVNNKLKNLPDALVEEVEKYIDFLTFKDQVHFHKDDILKNLNYFNKKFETNKSIS